MKTMINDNIWDPFANVVCTPYAPLKFGDGLVIPSTLYCACDYLPMLGLDLIHVCKKGCW